MTKPFQSIRQLFSRVIGGNPGGEDPSAREYSTLEIGSPEAQPSTNGNGQATEFSGEDSPPDLETQTADTQRLPQFAPELVNSRNGGASQPRVEHDESADEFGDVLLDLGDVRRSKAFAGDDPFLDILGETAPHDHFLVEAVPEATAPVEDS